MSVLLLWIRQPILQISYSHFVEKIRKNEWNRRREIRQLISTSHFADLNQVASFSRSFENMTA